VLLRLSVQERCCSEPGREAPAQAAGQIATGAEARDGDQGLAYQILHPAILMMKPAKDWPRGKLAVPLDRPIVGRILAQRRMSSELVVIAGVSCKNSTQMGLTKDDNVIKTLSLDRTNQPLRMPVLPG
jgi:hypothetical protein